MNQRIQELAEQAGAIFEKTNGTNDCPQDSLVGDEIEKFAELIVKKCMDLVASRPYIDDGNWSHPSMMIKQHFGVEE